MTTEIIGGEVVELLNPAGKKTAAEWTVRHKADAQLATQLQQPVLRVARPKRVLGLQRGDRMDSMGSPDRLRAGLGQPKVPHFPFTDQFGHASTVSSMGVLGSTRCW